MKIKFPRYDNTFYELEFEKTTNFCPNCGKQAVWVDDCDDYYVGCGYHCVECLSEFHMPQIDTPSEDTKIFVEQLQAVQ